MGSPGKIQVIFRRQTDKTRRIIRGYDRAIRVTLESLVWVTRCFLVELTKMEIIGGGASIILMPLRFWCMNSPDHF